MFGNNKNDRMEQPGINIPDKKMYIEVYVENRQETHKGEVYDWQLSILLSLKYIIVDSYECKINKIFFEVNQRNPELNNLYIYAERI